MIAFRGKELCLDLRSRHARGKRGCKTKKETEKEEIVEFDDDDASNEEIQSSISDILSGLYRENEDSNTGKRGAEDKYDERCPKRIKVDVHRVDDKSPCKTVVKSSQVAKASDINLHKDDSDKTEDAVDNSVKEDENGEVTADEETEDDEKSGTDENNEQTTSTEEKEEKTETVSKDSESQKETIEGSE